MVRPIRPRRIFFQPEITYFKPAGIPLANLEETNLGFEELEAIRLIDYEGIDQNKAGKKMKISQSTLSRLLKQGRKKLASAIINGNAIRVQGGNFKMAEPIQRGRGLGVGRPITGGRGRMGGKAAGPGGVCKCPKCGYETPQIRAQPCIERKCPKCGNLMVRE